MRPTAIALALALTLAPALAGCMADDGAESPGPDAAEGDFGKGDASGTGPAWSFTDTNGTTHSRDAAAGAPSVLFFMATWCTTCKGKTPALADLHAEYADRVAFFSVSVDPNDADPALEDWKARYAQPWPHGRDGADRDMQRTFNVKATSWVVVLDARGNEILNAYHPDADAIRGAIEDAFARGA